MPSFPSIILLFLSTVLLAPALAWADLRLYVGTLEVVTSSGKACGGLRGRHEVSVVLGSDNENNAYSGILGGEDVSIGRFSGTSLDRLALRYPFADPALAEGHSVKFSISGTQLNGELRDKHVDDSADECNFDLARLALQQSEQDEAAIEVFQQLSARFEALLARSTALSLLRSGAYAEAVHQYEKALTLADRAFPYNPPKLAPFLTGLANAYMRLGRFEEFIHLHAVRYPVIIDEAVRSIFNGHLIRSYYHLGRAALGREEYPAALDYFRKMLAINPLNKDAIAAIMSTYVRSGQHDEAIAFLEQTEQRLENEPDRNDVRGAIALIQYQKAKKADQAGRYAEAQANLLKAIKLDPGTVQYPIVLARWRHKSGSYHEADLILKKALERFKDGPSRTELTVARDKLKITEMMLKKLRRSGG